MADLESKNEVASRATSKGRSTNLHQAKGTQMSTATQAATLQALSAYRISYRKPGKVKSKWYYGETLADVPAKLQRIPLVWDELYRCWRNSDVRHGTIMVYVKEGN